MDRTANIYSGGKVDWSRYNQLLHKPKQPRISSLFVTKQGIIEGEKPPRRFAPPAPTPPVVDSPPCDAYCRRLGTCSAELCGAYREWSKRVWQAVTGSLQKKDAAPELALRKRQRQKHEESIIADSEEKSNGEEGTYAVLQDE